MQRPGWSGGSSLVVLAIQAVLLLILLAILAGVVFVILALASVANMPGQVASGVGGPFRSVASEASQALGNAQRALQASTDPEHPPSGLTYDTEITALDVRHVGDPLPGARDYALTVAEIQRRSGAESPDVALYAVVHAELRQPRETRLFGVVIRTDGDPHDHALYKGEAFRIGRSLYRVNWVSQEQGAIAIGQYRYPDGATQPLKLAYD